MGPRPLFSLGFVAFCIQFIGFTKVSLLFILNLLILPRFRCFLDQLSWFYQGFGTVFLRKTKRELLPGAPGPPCQCSLRFLIKK